jgi:hypothetical protein
MTFYKGLVGDKPVTAHCFPEKQDRTGAGSEWVMKAIILGCIPA